MAISEDSLIRSDAVVTAPSSPMRDNNSSSGGGGGGGGSSSSVKTTSSSKNVFKALRMCRLARDINCAEIIGNSLLLGVDDGLYSFEADGKI